jgi:hypothetical protein
MPYLHSPKLPDRLVTWTHGRRAKLKGAKMSRQNLSNVDFTDADLRNCDLRHCDLSGAKLPSWDSGLLEGVRLSGAKGWIPANKDMRYARLQGADLSGGHDLSYVDLTNADLRDCNLKQANLHRAVLLGAQGGREETIEAASYASRRGLWNDLKVDQPIVFSLTVAAALRVRFVVLANMHGPTRTCDSNDCVRRFEVFTASQEEGPWSSVTALCASKVAPKVRQTFEVADDAALVAGFVKVVVHDTYGGKCCLASLQLVGEAFG